MMLRRALLLCGAISSILYLAAIDVVAPLQHPEYHDYTSQMVSELMAVGAPTRPLMVALFIPYNILVFPFAAGVWAAARGRVATRLAAAALLGYGAMSSAGLLLAPMDVRGAAGMTERDVVHIWATALQGVFIALALVFGAFSLGARFRWLALGTLAICLAFGALASVAVTREAPWLGLAERVNIYAWMLWVLAFAVALLRDRRLRVDVDPAVRARRR